MSELQTVRSAELIAGEINAIKAQTRQVMISAALEIGKKLIEAKNLVPHGSWGAWLEENVDYSERKAQDMMRLYEEYGKKAIPQAIAELDYTKAVALLALPDEFREGLAERATEEDMSVRDLQAEIARLREELDSRQLRLDDLLKEAEEVSVLQHRAEEAEAAVDALRVEAEKARDRAKKERMRAGDAVLNANNVRKENAELKARIQELEAAPPTVEEKVVEVIPQDMLEELEQLRRQAKAAPNEAVIKLRAGYERLLGEFRAVETLLAEVRETDAAVADRYAAALKKGCERMAEAFGGGADGQA